MFVSWTIQKPWLGRNFLCWQIVGNSTENCCIVASKHLGAAKGLQHARFKVVWALSQYLQIVLRPLTQETFCSRIRGLGVAFFGYKQTGKTWRATFTSLSKSRACLEVHVVAWQKTRNARYLFNLFSYYCQSLSSLAEEGLKSHEITCNLNL